MSINGCLVGVGVSVTVGERVAVLGTVVRVGVRVTGLDVFVTVGDKVGVDEGNTKIF